MSLTEDEARSRSSESGGALKAGRDKDVPGGWRVINVAKEKLRDRKRRRSAGRLKTQNIAYRKYNRGAKRRKKEWARGLKKYGITVRQYNLMLQRQNGACDICGNPPKNRRLATDHDHVTGRVRGLLCWLCNHKLVGRHREPNLFRKVADYLASDFDGRQL